jgi:hypothetical protein
LTRRLGLMTGVLRQSSHGLGFSLVTSSTTPGTAAGCGHCQYVLCVCASLAICSGACAPTLHQIWRAVRRHCSDDEGIRQRPVDGRGGGVDSGRRGFRSNGNSSGRSIRLITGGASLELDDHKCDHDHNCEGDHDGPSHDPRQPASVGSGRCGVAFGGGRCDVA